MSTQTIQKSYVYWDSKGKAKVIKSSYIVKQPTSMKNKANKKIVSDYLNEHIEEITAIPKHKRNSYMVGKIKDDLNLDVSFCGMKSALGKLSI